ncbi:MAG: EAL domain-containing protein [Bauldia sp.]|nr:EAL domain-containing protein [Bauldia sp.]
MVRQREERAGTRRVPRSNREPRPRGTEARIRAQLKAVAEARAAAEAAERAANLAHERLREAIDILPEGVVFLDGEGRYILWNQQYAEIYQRSADLFRPGVRLEDTLRIGVMRGDYPDALGREEAWIAERLDHLYHPHGRHEQTLSDGRVILIEEKRTADGGVIGLRVDITEMKRRERSFRLLFDANPVPMFVYGLDDQVILAANDAAVAHYGFARAALLGANLAMVQPADANQRDEVAEDPEDQAGRTWRHRKADGRMIDVAVYTSRLSHDGVPAVLMAAIDITERKRAEARIAFMAHHDALTALPNRVTLRERMEQLLAQSAGQTGPGLATLCIDLDDFKSINDTLGHPFGDRLLQKVADRLRHVLRQGDLVARLGGDEFAVLQTAIAAPNEVSHLAERLIEAISAPYELDGHHVTIGASIGIALAPGDGDDPDQLLKNADLALYRAKADGRGTFRFFEPEMDARIQARRALELDLRSALQSGALDVHYQPLVSLDTGAVTGCEALVRWRHPQRGDVPPSEFIAVAEETGLIGQLGAFVLGRACADAAEWPPEVKVAVNLSPLQFRSGALLGVVQKALERSRLPARRLELEITETLLLDRSGIVLATLHALRALGVHISMDDFGTGYSSLSYLRSFPFDKIKIDRSFVHELSDSRDQQAIVRAIVSLGASLGMTITAEGVERERDLDRLRAEGCNEGQGFLFSAARPAEEIAELLGVRRQQRGAA